jgi:hypothetical protein
MMKLQINKMMELCINQFLGMKTDGKVTFLKDLNKKLLTEKYLLKETLEKKDCGDVMKC